MADMRIIKQITIHCSASPNGESLFKGKLGDKGFQTPVEVIDAWHRARNFKRSEDAKRRFNPSLTSIGYHFVIYTNGAVATGRSIEEVGAGVAGQNAHKIHICMVGTDKFTHAQWSTLAGVVSGLKKTYPQATVEGHRDCSPDLNGDGKITPNEWVKKCPGFEVEEWIASGMQPLIAHVLETPR